MTAAVAPHATISPAVVDDGISSSDEGMVASVKNTDTRKRLHEAITNDESQPESAASASTIEQPPAQRKRKVSSDTESEDTIDIPHANPIVKCISKPGKVTKKPQMKYDPDVPMTKEQAAIWRREQRRKRNRESAAASRQRQRDRITELETEVEQWRLKYDSIMRQVRDLERMTGRPHHHAPSPAHRAREMYGSPHHHHHHHVHPPHVPPHHPPMMRAPPRSHSPEPQRRAYHHHSKSSQVISPPSTVHAPISHPSREDMYYIHRTASVSPYASPAPHEDSSSDEHEEGPIIEYHKTSKRHSEFKHSSKISSRPAVKITDASPPTFPILSTDDSLLPPDICASEEPEKLEPMDQAILEEAADAVLSVTNHETPEEFSEFLLDAVDWL